MFGWTGKTPHLRLRSDEIAVGRGDCLWAGTLVFRVPIVADDLPFSEDVLFERGTHVMDNHEFSAWTATIGDEADMIEATIENPVDDVTRAPVFIDGQISFLGPKENRHIFDSPMVNIRIEFALRIKAQVSSLVFNDELLKVEADDPIGADNDIGADPLSAGNVTTRIFQSRVGRIVGPCPKSIDHARRR